MKITEPSLEIPIIATITQNNKGLILHSRGGLGKTKRVILANKGLGTKVIVVYGKVTASDLFRKVYAYRNGYVIVLDEAGQIFRNHTAVEIMKGILEEGIAQWESVNPAIADIPHKFKVTSKFIMNINEVGITEDVKALISRCMYVYFNLTNKQVYDKFNADLLLNNDVSNNKGNISKGNNNISKVNSNISNTYLHTSSTFSNGKVTHCNSSVKNNLSNITYIKKYISKTYTPDGEELNFRIFRHLLNLKNTVDLLYSSNSMRKKYFEIVAKQLTRSVMKGKRSSKSLEHSEFIKDVIPEKGMMSSHFHKLVFDRFGWGRSSIYSWVKTWSELKMLSLCGGKVYQVDTKVQ